MIACSVTVGNRGGDPVRVKSQEIKEFPCYDCYFSGINAVRTENGTAAALGALEKIVPPLLEYVYGQVSRARKFTYDLSGCTIFLPIY